MRLLLCDTFPGLLPEYIPSYAWMFTRLFDSVSAQPGDYEVYPAMEGIFPPLQPNDDIHLITGCNLSVYDDVDWIRALLHWIRRADQLQLKVVGICFGHQAVAQALGGQVHRATVGWGTGIRESQVSGEALHYFPEGHMRLFYNHHDQVTDLPPAATRIATSAFCPNEAFTVGSHIITFQGHPEYLPSYAVHLLMNFADDEPPAVRQAALRSIGLHQHQGDTVARWILQRYK